MFQGFSEEATQFLWGIRLNNEKPWFEAHKQTYLMLVQAPLKELAGEVHEAFLEKHPELTLNLRVSRIYRDARRLHGRGPYKSNLWFSIRGEDQNWTERPVFWFEIRPDGYAFGLGIYMAKAATMERFRQAVDAHPEKMIALAKKFQRQQRFSLEAEEYKRKKGAPPAPLDQWYNRKTLDLCCVRQVDGLLYHEGLREELLDGFEFLLPYYRYFEEFCSPIAP